MMSKNKRLYRNPHGMKQIIDEENRTCPCAFSATRSFLSDMDKYGHERGLSRSILVRLAIAEYIKNHPCVNMDVPTIEGLKSAIAKLKGEL